MRFDYGIRVAEAGSVHKGRVVGGSKVRRLVWVRVREVSDLEAGEGQNIQGLVAMRGPWCLY